VAAGLEAQRRGSSRLQLRQYCPRRPFAGLLRVTARPGGAGRSDSFEWPNDTTSRAIQAGGKPRQLGSPDLLLAKGARPLSSVWPSIVYPDVALLGDQSSYLDYGSFHDYRGGRARPRSRTARAHPHVASPLGRSRTSRPSSLPQRALGKPTLDSNPGSTSRAPRSTCCASTWSISQTGSTAATSISYTTEHERHQQRRPLWLIRADGTYKRRRLPSRTWSG